MRPSSPNSSDVFFISEFWGADNDGDSNDGDSNDGFSGDGFSGDGDSNDGDGGPCEDSPTFGSRLISIKSGDSEKRLTSVGGSVAGASVLVPNGRAEDAAGGAVESNG